MKKLGLSTRVFIGFGLGILLGVIFGEKVLVIKIIGDIFLKLIKMLTVPLVFFSIISGITNLTDVNKLKRRSLACTSSPHCWLVSSALALHT